jgi:DNA-directed RNA polymerase specialized sigma24 family protein
MSTQADALSDNALFWEQAYKDHFGSLCTRACKRLTRGNSVEAEDAVSEAFLRVIRYAPDPKTIQNVVSYLWTIVRRVWVAEQTRPGAAFTDRLDDLKLDEIEKLPSVRVEPEILSLLERKDFLLELKIKLGPLSLAETTMIELRLDSFSLDEIATVLDEDVEVTRFRWYKFIARQRYRLNKAKATVKSAQA